MDKSISRAVASMSEKSSFAFVEKAKAYEARTGIPVVHFEIGQPDFDTPPHIKEVATLALQSGKTKYVAPSGIPALRQALAVEVAKTRGEDVSPDQVVISPSGKTAMLMAIAAVVNPGDEVIYPDPGFPSYRNLITFFGGIPIPLPLREENDFKPALTEFEKLFSTKTKLVILNFPSNPTGSVLSREERDRIVAFLASQNCYILTDEIYSQILYEEEFQSLYLPVLRERAFLLDGFSKTYAMTGWRLGYLVVPSHLAAGLDTLAVNVFGCTAPFVQEAGLAAITGPQDAAIAMKNEFKNRRDVVVSGLRSIPGITCSNPGGAFYVLPSIKKFGISSEEFAERLLESEGVSLLAGSIYGDYGEGHVRISYATSLANIKEGIARLRRFAGTL